MVVLVSHDSQKRLRFFYAVTTPSANFTDVPDLFFVETGEGKPSSSSSSTEFEINLISRGLV